MGFEKEKLKQIRRMVLYIALIVLVLIYSDTVFHAIGIFVGFMKPFIYGGVIAFILNIPLRFIENRVFSKNYSAGVLFLASSAMRIISTGVRYFFLLLHSLQQTTTLPLVDLPPLTTGTIWSIVNSSGGNFPPQ